MPVFGRHRNCPRSEVRKCARLVRPRRFAVEPEQYMNYDGFMAVSKQVTGAGVSARSARDLTRDYVLKWSAICGEFLVWEREHMLMIEPSTKDHEEHRQSLTWLL